MIQRSIISQHNTTESDTAEHSPKNLVSIPGVSADNPALISLNKGMLLRFKKEIPQAIEVLEKALKQFSTQASIIGQAFCQIELAWLYGTQNDNAGSQRLFQKTEELIDHHTLENGIGEAKTRLLHYKGLLQYEPGSYGQAVKLFKEALNHCDPNALEAAKVYDSLGVHYERTGDFHRAIRHLKNSLHIKRQYPDLLHEEAITCQILGRLYLIYEEYELALSNLQRSLEVTVILKDEKRKSQLKIELIRLYLRCGREKEAKDLITEARHDCQQRHLHVQLALTYFYEAFLAYQHMQLEEAYELLEKKVRPVFERQNYRKGLAMQKRLQAWVKFALTPEEHQEAIALIGDAIALFRQENMIEEVSKSHFELGKLYNQINSQELALASFLDALKLAEENGLFHLMPYVEDEIYRANAQRWMEIVNKRASHERVFEKQNSLIETLSGYLQTKNNNTPLEEELLEQLPKLNTSDQEDKAQTKSLSFLLTLLRVGEAVAGVRNIDSLLGLIAHETEVALVADRCTVFLYDEDTQELWSRLATGIEGAAEIRFSAHSGISGYVVKTGQSLNIVDAYSDPRFNPEVDQQTNYKTRNMLCVPMKNRKNQIIGVFQVLNKNEGPFEKADEELLSAIASTAGVALENAQLYQELKITFESFIKTLSSTIDARDPITSGHSERVTDYALAIGEKMMLNADELEALKYAGLLHDIGKIGVREEVLMKEGRLTVKEYEHIQSHVYLTDQILKNIRFEKHLCCVPEIASSHHEKVDGTGYFRGAKGDEIPLGGRILAVADVFDAITSRRQYRSRMPFERVINILRNESGKHFDANCIEAFFDVSLRQIARIFCFDKHLDMDPIVLDENLNQIDEQLTLRQYVNQLNSEAQSEVFMKSHEHFAYLYNLTEICDMD